MKTTIGKGERIFLSFTVLALAILLINQSGFSQDIKKNKSSNPDVKINVKKEYDDKGNVVGYDSTYSYSWSSNGSLPVDIDSIFNSLNQSFPFKIDMNFGFDEQYLDWPFANDSSISNPFDFPNRLSKLPFDWNPWDQDSSNQDGYEMFGKDFQEIIKHQQELMDHFMKRFNYYDEFEFKSPLDTITSKHGKTNKIYPEKQNYQSHKKSNNSILI